jgi:TolB protein
MKSPTTLYFAGSLFIATIILSGCCDKLEHKIDTPVFSPDGQYIIFSLIENGSEHICRIKNNGMDFKRLTMSKYRADFDAIYSPDGLRIAFSSIKKYSRRKDADLYIMNSDGTGVKRLTDDSYSDVSPVFSPDGERIYFLRAKDFAVRHSPTLPNLRWYDIYSINTDGTGLKAITNTDFDRLRMDSLSVSPDGGFLLVRDDTDESENTFWLIPIYNPEEWKPLRPNNQKGDFYDPRFSPDGRSILFTWWSRPGIYIMDLQTNEYKQLAMSCRVVESPSFSYDGTKIVFVNVLKEKWEKEKYELWQVNTDGSDLRRIEVMPDK